MLAKYELYTYYRSSCSARVRIAAHLKGIVLTYHFVHLLKNEQTDRSYAVLNPSASVPVLVRTDNDGSQNTIRQSVAILEFLEEAEQDCPSLLPPLSNPERRARVRELVNIIACDTQPATNLRILKQVEAMGGDKFDWALSLIMQGLSAYEALSKSYAGIFSVGDEVTLADVCLVPAVDGGIRFGLDLASLPTIAQVYANLQKLPAVQKGSWRSQPDTPEEVRTR